MTLTIRHVEQTHVHQLWHMVEPFIIEALQKGDEFPADTKNYTAEHVRAFLGMGQWLLLVAVDEEMKVHGAAAVSFLDYPLHRVAFITAIGGRLVTGEETFKQFQTLLRARGATKIQGFVRPAMERFLEQFGFEPRNKLVEVML